MFGAMCGRVSRTASAKRTYHWHISSYSTIGISTRRSGSSCEALELNPTYANGHFWYSIYSVVTGRYDEAIERIRMALELEPLSRIINANHGQWLSVAGRYEEAHEQLRKTSELDPAWAYAHRAVGGNYARQGLYSEAVPHYEQAMMLENSPYRIGWLGHAYAKSGRVAEAHGVLARLDELAETRYVSPLERAAVYAGLGDLDKFFEWLERAYEGRASDMPFVRNFPGVEDVEQDPRFAELLRRVGLEE